MNQLDINLEEITTIDELKTAIVQQLGEGAYAKAYAQLVEDHGDDGVDLLQSGLWEMLTDYLEPAA